MKFRLLGGKHIEEPKSGLQYRKGDVIESDNDLCHMFNQHGCRKFEKLAEDVAPTAPTPPVPVEPEPQETEPEEEVEEVEQEEVEDAYSDMTVAQLKAFAREGGINLRGCTNRQAILNKLREEVS